MKKEPDGFDRFVDWVYEYILWLRWFRAVYIPYKEFWLYALFGAGTVAVNLLVYDFFTVIIPLGVIIGNSVAWIFATLFAFLTNRKYVFVSHEIGVKAFFAQMFSFFSGRFVTLILEDAILYIFVDLLQWPNMGVKLAAQFIVIATNYFISKLIVFSKKPSTKNSSK